MAEQLASARKLVELAEQSLAVDEAEVETFLELTDRYLIALDAWKVSIESAFPGGLESHPDRSELQTVIHQLQPLHTAVVDRSERLRDDIAHRLTEMRHRASALKAYVDKLPKRITLTGRREG